MTLANETRKKVAGTRALRVTVDRKLRQATLLQDWTDVMLVGPSYKPVD